MSTKQTPTSKPSVKKVIPGTLVLEPGVKHHIKSKYGWINHTSSWKTKNKSLTIPGRTLTLRQISERFANGMSTIDEKIALYDDGVVVIKDFEKLDLTVRQEIIAEARAQIQENLNRKQLAAKQKQEKEFSELVEKKVAERVNQMAKPPEVPNP